MKVADFELYKGLLYERSGLVVTPDKSYLLDSRLTPVAKKWNFSSLEMMTVQLRAIPDPALVKDIVEAMTTNETSFFRDTKPFQLFQEVVLPHMLQARATKRTVRIWCAASSSGQEPYSLAMTLKEKEAQLRGWKFEITATDISEEILEQARKGVYTQFEVQRGLPIQYLMKYFEQVGENWKLKDEIRNSVRFAAFNLLGDMTRMGTFDVIFCRNVLIYFDDKTKAGVLEKMSRALEKDGFLFLGGAETVLGISDKFSPMPEKRGLYIKPEGHPQSAAGVPSSSATASSLSPSSPVGGGGAGSFKRF